MDGYTFSSGSFQGVQQTWEALLASLDEDLKTAEKLAVVKAPGHEPASGFVARDQNSSGEALRNSILQMRAFVDSYRNNLGHAQTEYDAQETSVEATMRSGERG